MVLVFLAIENARLLIFRLIIHGSDFFDTQKSQVS